MSLEIHTIDQSTSMPIPFADEGIRAGFPSPAQDYMQLAIDLNLELINNPASTFYGRVVGDSMIDAQIYEGDLLVIDKSLEPRDGDLAVCFLDGEFTLKYIEMDGDIIWLKPANKDFKPIKVTVDNEFVVWGIVTYTIKKRR
ncbi:MAG: translesion error-prone DNA polymerase V autoproteolytic subunit [Bacteroidaceae bacterium]